MQINLVMPKITLLYAGILGLAYFALSVYVVSQRRAKLVGIGHGTDPKCSLFRAVRIHGNFAEFVPFLLLLMALDEITGRNIYILHSLGTAIILGRVGHFVGIRKSDKVSRERFFGVVVTFLCLITLSLFLIVKGVS